MLQRNQRIQKCKIPKTAKDFRNRKHPTECKKPIKRKECREPERMQRLQKKAKMQGI